MKEITITLPDNTIQVVPANTLPKTILEQFHFPPKSVLGLKVNNDIVSLTEPLTVSCTVEPIIKGTHEASAIYRRSLCFVLAAASHTLFPQERLLVGHSLGYSYYYSFASGKKLTEKDISSLKERMMQLITADTPIETESYSYPEVVAILEKMNLVETRKQLNYLGKPVFKLNKVLSQFVGFLLVFEMK